MMRLLLLGLLILLLGCDDKSYRVDNTNYIVDNLKKNQRSTTAGNLVATAIKEVHDLDIVFYPTDFLKNDGFHLLTNQVDLQQILDMYPPEGSMDQFMIGTLSGSAIKDFIKSRVTIDYSADLQVAGIEYAATYTGGIGSITFSRKYEAPLEDDQYYRVAISNHFYFSGTTFPSYQYGDGLDYQFKPTVIPMISARAAITAFVKSSTNGFPELTEIRANVENHTTGEIGSLPIYAIQGNGHFSPYLGKIITTRGVITAIGTRAWYPGGVDLYIQDLNGDNNIATSDAVHVYLPNDDTSLKFGDYIEVRGTIYEQMTGSGLSRTSIRDVITALKIDHPVEVARNLVNVIGFSVKEATAKAVKAQVATGKARQELILLEQKFGTAAEMTAAREKVKKTNELSAQAVKEMEEVEAKFDVEYAKADTISRAAMEQPLLPEPVRLGSEGREIPTTIISSYNGDLNYKKSLTLTDGIDFYESVEGMRVSISNPRLAGFRGGKEEKESRKAKGYLTFYMVPDGDVRSASETKAGGLMSVPEHEDYNPELITITTNHLTKGINTARVFNVGDKFDGALTGVMSYEKNIFGDGEYTMVLPEDQNIAVNLKSKFESTSKIIPLDKRPISKLPAGDDQLTISTYNVENLAGNQYTRLKDIGESIAVNLACPDIVNLVEIQDLNGAVYTGASSADETLQRLIRQIDCGENVNYKAVNIDPVNHAEGGEPGGNIRVAHIYNANKVQFKPRGTLGPLIKTVVLPDGSLSDNPGRVFPNDRAFDKSRKSLVVEYIFKGERVFVIGNHFKSKLGDSSHWGNIHPATYVSDSRRVRMAAKMSEFVQMIYHYNPRAHVAVVGDFNAYPNEGSMKVLEGAGLYNMVYMLPSNERYTHNYNGSSNALDHIFVGDNLMRRNAEFEILHINTDYMGRLSDHDPVIARFQF